MSNSSKLFLKLV